MEAIPASAVTELSNVKIMMSKDSACSMCTITDLEYDLDYRSPISTAFLGNFGSRNLSIKILIQIHLSMHQQNHQIQRIVMMPAMVLHFSMMELWTTLDLQTTGLLRAMLFIRGQK